MLSISNLSKSFSGVEVVSGVSLSIERGKMLALIGRSGSGKTTTLKMINRLIEPSGGTILVDGVDVQEVEPVALRRRIGYVIQQGGLFPHYTVAENIGVVPGLTGEDPEETAQKVPGMLESVGLDPDLFAGKYPGELSGGEAQRVALLRALAARPPLLLMDEPFSALDPITRADVRTSFRELIAAYGSTVVLVTHDIAEALEMADKIALLEKGRVVREGDGRSFLFGADDAFVSSFFEKSRFESELRVITVGELLPTTEMIESDDPALEVSSDTTLSSIITGAGSDLQRPVAITRADGSRFSTTPAALIIGFLSYRGERDGAD